MSLEGLSASELFELGGLKVRCGAAVRCATHGLALPCDICDNLGGNTGVICSACNHHFTQGLLGQGERPCQSEAEFLSTRKIAFEEEARVSLEAKERERLEIAERARIEEDRAELRRVDDERRIEAQRRKAERERAKSEQRAREESERVARERAEAERTVREERERVEREQAAADLIESRGRRYRWSIIFVSLIAVSAIVAYFNVLRAPSIENTQIAQPQSPAASTPKATIQPKPRASERRTTPGDPARSPDQVLAAATEALARIVKAVNARDSLSANAAPGEIAEVDEATAAIAALPKPARGDRKEARGLLNAGLALIGQNGRAGEAADILLKAHIADPLDVQIVNDLAFAEIAAGRPRAAQAHLLMALTLSPTRASAWVNFGDLKASPGNDAPRAIDDAVRLYVVGYWFSRNRAKMLNYLGEKAASLPASATPAWAAEAALQRIRALDKDIAQPAGAGNTAEVPKSLPAEPVGNPEKETDSLAGFLNEVTKALKELSQSLSR